MCTYTFSKVLGKNNMNNLVWEKIIENFSRTHKKLKKSRPIFLLYFRIISIPLYGVIDGVYTPTDRDRTGRVKTLAVTFCADFEL